MSRQRISGVSALVLSVVVLAAGCGRSASSARAPGQVRAGGSVSLNSSLVTVAGTWAVAVMGGSSAQENNFWQLFVRLAGSARWKLVTPPGVADNGGLVVAGAGGRSLVAGFRPSQDLTFTPLTATGNGGQQWSSSSPLDGAVADVPDAMAVAPHGGHLLALLADGKAELAAPGYSTWTVLASLRSLAGTSAGRRCGLQNLTGVAFTPSGIPLIAGACRHRGTAGILADKDGTWQLAGPVLPAALAGQTVSVLTVATAPSGAGAGGAGAGGAGAGSTVALLTVGSGSAATLLAAWSSDNGNHWALSAPFELNGAKLTAISSGLGGPVAVVLNRNRGATIAGSGSSWRSLPALPAGTVTLTPGANGGFDALAVHQAVLTVWQLAPGSANWRTTQTIDVPIEFGSSS